MKLFKSKWSMCKRKTKSFQKYKLPSGKELKCCLHCSEYAERRAYMKVY